jgi:hypothetical protein
MMSPNEFWWARWQCKSVKIIYIILWNIMLISVGQTTRVADMWWFSGLVLCCKYPQFHYTQALSFKEEMLHHHLHCHLQHTPLSHSITLHHHTPSRSITILHLHLIITSCCFGFCSMKKDTTFFTLTEWLNKSLWCNDNLLLYVKWA